MRLAALLTILGLSALAVGPMACTTSTDDGNDGTGTSDPQTSDGADEEVKAAVISEKDNGKTVDVQLGRSFSILLESNASTGYRWSVKSVDRTLGQPKQTTIPGDPNRPGAAGAQKFTWSTKSPLNLVGKHQIQLEYQRPWAENSPPAKTFSVTVNIVDAAPTAKKCGGLAGIQCAAGTYCEFTAAQACGMADQQGTCQKKPEFCPEVYSPVCGCDGKEYGNSCFANAAGTSVAHEGKCNAGGVRCGNTTCAAGDVCCNPIMNICTRPGMFCIQ
jgi:predicted secreted protein